MRRGTGTRTDSQQFAQDCRPGIVRLLNVEPRLCHAMDQAWFNPVRDYVSQDRISSV